MQEGMTQAEYKACILDTFKQIEDPFGMEIVGGELNYEQNPSEPTKPQKTLQIATYEALKWD